jgi:hypothetical protein
VPTRETTVKREEKRSESRAGEFGGGEGDPKIRLGKEEMGHPRVAAMSAASGGGTFIGTKQDLWKLMARPVAAAKSSST